MPSPEGDWLSDASVVECEAELKRSGVVKLLRVGDIVWDVAVGDEGNLGRLMWDGSYLVVCCRSLCGLDRRPSDMYPFRIWTIGTPGSVKCRPTSTAWRSLLRTSIGSFALVDLLRTIPIAIRLCMLT